MVGCRITALRKKTGISQEQLARQINVCASAVGMYEQGRREPSIKLLIAISQVFGVSLDYLLTGTEAPDRGVERIAGVLFVLQADLPGVSETLLLNEADLVKVIEVLRS